MTAAALIEEVRAAGLELHANGDKLRLPSHPIFVRQILAWRDVESWIAPHLPFRLNLYVA